MDDKPYSIVVADLHPIAAEGIRALVRSAGDMVLADAVNSLSAALDAARRLLPSVLLVDKSFGLPAVTEFVAALKTAGLNLPVVVWGATLSEAEVLRAVQAGARGIVRKSDDLTSILECLRSVSGGGVWVAGTPATAQPLSAQRLTQRERQVVELVLQGMRNREIAQELGMRPGTVKVHLKHIFEKTGIRGRYGLALSSLRQPRTAAACS